MLNAVKFQGTYNQVLNQMKDDESLAKEFSVDATINFFSISIDQNEQGLSNDLKKDIPRTLFVGLDKKNFESNAEVNKFKKQDGSYAYSQGSFEGTVLSENLLTQKNLETPGNLKTLKFIYLGDDDNVYGFSFSQVNRSYVLVLTSNLFAPDSQRQCEVFLSYRSSFLEDLLVVESSKFALVDIIKNDVKSEWLKNYLARNLFDSNDMINKKTIDKVSNSLRLKSRVPNQADNVIQSDKEALQNKSTVPNKFAKVFLCLSPISLMFFSVGIISLVPALIATGVLLLLAFGLYALDTYQKTAASANKMNAPGRAEQLTAAPRRELKRGQQPSLRNEDKKAEVPVGSNKTPGPS